MTASTAALSRPRRERNVWRNGMSARDISKLTGLSVSYIKRAFAGRFTPALPSLRLLARAMGKTVHELAVEMDITDPPPLKPREGFYPVIDPRKVNRSDVARKTGLTLSYVSRILSANPVQRRQPRPMDLAILAKHFRCSMDHLIRCWKL